jgi:OOP family OmpA-OmpF porin
MIMGTLQYASVVAAIALMGFSGGVAAQNDAGFYIGGNIGQSKINDLDEACDEFRNDLNALGIVATVDCDDTDTAFKAYAGYQFNKYLAAELGYVDLGSPEPTATSGNVTGGFKFETKAFFVEAVGMIPVIGGLSILGRVGAARWDVDVEATGAFAPLGSESDDGVSLVYGAGLQWMFTKNFGLRAEYEVYDSVGDEDTTGESDIHMYSLGVLFKF